MKTLSLILMLAMLSGCTREAFGSRDDGGSLTPAPDAPVDQSTNNATSNGNNDVPDAGAGGNNDVDPGEVFEPSAGFRDVDDQTWSALEAVTRATFTDVTAVPGNVAFSPVSLVNTLVVTGLAGNSSTRAAAANRLASDAFAQVASGISAVAQTAALENVQLLPTYWVDLDTQIDEGFLQSVYPALLRDVRSVDFGDPVVARQTINNYYRAQTEGVISSAVDALALDGDPSAALVDAVYFRQTWASPFDANASTQGTFEGTAGPQSAVFMRQSAEFNVTRSQGFDAVVVPYAGQFSLVAVLPADDAQRRDLETRFSVAMLDAIVAESVPESVDLWFPRIEVAGRLDSELFGSDVAANAAADDGLEASGATGATALIQRTIVAFDEAGTTGVTVGDADGLGAAAPAVDLRFDRPFLFAVRDDASGLLLVVGRVESL